jgi:hypothetical protein
VATEQRLPTAEFLSPQGYYCVYSAAGNGTMVTPSIQHSLRNGDALVVLQLAGFSV